ncbi:MAG: TrmB family transcriptional regulator [Candidatus Thorarchaeota archaeon]|nr:MAG: TrmB family transcriptional regulator [Candidatus Thorarchaeota archaeon]
MTGAVYEAHESTALRAVRLLRELGFGAHETEVILSLNRTGSCTVAEISEATGIHHANLYGVLESLDKRGLVVRTGARPRTYEFASLSHVEDMFSTRVTQLIDDLEKLQAERSKLEPLPTLIYTIRGQADVLAKMHNMVAKAKTSIMFVASCLSELEGSFLESLEHAAKRGVKIRIIAGEKPSKIEFEAEIRLKRNTLAINLITDSDEALIAMPDFSVCGWADIPMIAHQLEEFLNQTWGLSKEA